MNIFGVGEIAKIEDFLPLWRRYNNILDPKYGRTGLFYAIGPQMTQDRSVNWKWSAMTISPTPAQVSCNCQKKFLLKLIDISSNKTTTILQFILYGIQLGANYVRGRFHTPSSKFLPRIVVDDDLLIGEHRIFFRSDRQCYNLW